MRKRAQLKSTSEEIRQQTPIEKKEEKKRFTIKKNRWITISLVGIFCLVLLLNTYFNFVSDVNLNSEGDSLSEKFFLSGPDPYYNMRLVEETAETGIYPYYNEPDPMLNYPIGRSGSRAPLLNMMAIGFSRLLVPFMSESDALGYSMQFIPALFGALIIIPIFFIGKILFGEKAGVIAALLMAVVPIHIASGHGSAYALFDHDSFNLLLFFVAFLFLIKSIKEKNQIASVLYALLSGLSVAGLTMVWVEAQFIYAIIAVYAVVQMLYDIITKQIQTSFVRNMVLILLSGYLISLPVTITRMTTFTLQVPLMLAITVALFGLVYIFLEKKHIPWLLSIPSIIILGAVGAIFLYFVPELSQSYPVLSPLNRLTGILYGTGIYGMKVDQTIAEAGTYNISRSWMSYGPVFYALAWIGVVLLIIQFARHRDRKDYLFLIVLFFINIWLASTAGRFLNDLVPLVAIFAGFVTWYVIEKIDYKAMIRNIQNAGGGLRGIRKGIKIIQVFGILFVAILLLMPNVFLSLDAAVPFASTQNGTSSLKIDFFGENFSGAFGSSAYKEQYWVSSFSWLRDQDTTIDDPEQRPAFISWWDYGFYAAAVSQHPTVADNFQDGIPAAANFHTATSEEEAVSVFIVRLLQGDLRDHGGKLSTSVKNVLKNHVGQNTTNNITLWMENPQQSPSYNQPIGAEYDVELSQQLRVGEQYPENAYYHDITEIITTSLDDEQITLLYHDIQETTGYSIRYYGVEGYDQDIFNIFGFLGDKSLVLSALQNSGGLSFYNAEDEFLVIKYRGYKVNPDGTQGAERTWTAQEINDLPESERRYVAITDTVVEYKQAYYDSMFYRTYLGNQTLLETYERQIPQFPTWGMKHFIAEYISPYPYQTGKSAVVVAKYYEGAPISGSVLFNGEPLNCTVVIRKNVSLFDTPFFIDHDSADTPNGTFTVLAPAGNITLEVRRNPELGLNSFAIKTITFNSTDDPELAPITDDEAMRKNGTNFLRETTIIIPPANLSGYAYKNNDFNESYNQTIDEPLENVDITLAEITEFYPFTDEANAGQPKSFGSINELTTNENGMYETGGLTPGIYLVQALKDDFRIHENYVFIESGNNTYNFSQPYLAGVNGTIYFDDNENDEYDEGEELADVTVDLIYTDIGDEKQVSSIVTDSDGRYAFTDLIPGQYQLNATKLDITTGYPDLATKITINLTENTTSTIDVSLGYAPIIVSGLTRFNNQTIGDVQISFSPNATYENNTAQLVRKRSDDQGVYTVDLQPGYYNVSVVNEETDEGIFSFYGTLSLTIGQGVQTYDIILQKDSVTITGQTLYDSIPIGNISVDYRVVLGYENNTARLKFIESDINGTYTAEVMPGYYNVTVNERKTEDGQNVTYTFQDIIVVNKQDGVQTFDINLARETE